MAGVAVVVIKLISTTNIHRSSQHKCAMKKSALKNFTKFTGEHPCQSLFFKKTLLKKRLWHSSFPVNFAKFLRTPFLRLNLHQSINLATVTNYKLFLFLTPCKRSNLTRDNVSTNYNHLGHT